MLEPFEIHDLPDMEAIAAMLGERKGNDFSFVVRLRGRLHKVTCEHISRGKKKSLLGDIRPANRYGERSI